MRVKGKRMIVTGGALGIGRACSLLLAKEGAKVAVLDLLEAEGRSLASGLKTLEALHPVGRIGEPMDVAYGVL